MGTGSLLKSDQRSKLVVRSRGMLNRARALTGQAAVRSKQLVRFVNGLDIYRIQSIDRQRDEGDRGGGKHP